MLLVIRSRGYFLKFARRQLRRKFGISGPSIEKVSFKQRAIAICPILGRILGRDKVFCLLCGTAEQGGEQQPHVRCPTPSCIGLFCVQCFSDLQNMCTICKAPMEYGDLSDISEEK